MFIKMRVSLAAKTMSHSVAAGISVMVQFGHLTKSALPTAHFIEKNGYAF